MIGGDTVDPRKESGKEIGIVIDTMTIGIMTAIGIEEVKNIRDIGIEKLDQSQLMFAIIAEGLAIGPMSVTCRKSRSKLYIFL